MPRYLRWPATIALVLQLCAHAAAQGGDRPVAEIFGQAIYAKDLTTPGASPPDAASAERARGEALRLRVWKAVFEDYARSRRIAPTEAEINSQIAGHRRLKALGDAERARQREALIAELGSSSLSARRRAEAQQHLDLINRIEEFEAKRAAELRDPAQRKLHEEAEQRVAEHWVRQWKLSQALYREFGGRIIFQQAGWEPIDAYRALLEQQEARKGFVVHDAGFRAAVYAYFQHNFVYADEARARFYFEKPYWERTPEEMKAAGF